MLSAISKILICPFCKGEKPVLEPLFGHSLGGKLWSDMKTMLTENRPHEYEEVYKIQLNSPVIFADDDVHTIDWFVKVSGRGFQDAYKCEVDREEIPLGDDPYYKKKTTKDRHSVAAVVTFICQ